MSIIYREEKGAPLTAQELDGNFRHLEERLKAVERLHPGQRIQEVRIEGDYLVIYDGGKQAICQTKLPFVGLNPRGVWDPKGAYARNDLVTYGGGIYVCAKSHKPENFNQENWQPLLNNTEVSK